MIMGWFGGGGGGQAYIPTSYAAAPTTDSAEVKAAAAAEAELVRKERGRAATILTSSEGVADDLGGKKTLLGE